MPFEMMQKTGLATMNVACHDAFEAVDKFARSDKEYQEYLARESAILDYNTNFVEGQKLAEEKGETRVLELIKHLQKAGRMNDLSAAMENPDQLAALYREFHID